MKTITRNKKVHSKLAITCSFTIFVLIKFAINNFNSEIEWQIYISILLFFLAIIFLLVTLNSIIEIFKPKIALEISPEGIKDLVSFSEAGFIEWDKVENIFIDKLKGNNHLIIKFIPKYNPPTNSSIFKRILTKDTKQKFGNAIAINKDYVNEDLENILYMIDKARVPQ